MAIRWKLMLIMVVVSLFPLLLFISSAGLETRAVFSEEIGRSYELLARDKAQAVAMLLNRRIKETQLLASHPAIVDAVVAHNAASASRPEQEVSDEISRIDQEWIASKGKMARVQLIRENRLSRFLDGYRKRDPLEYGELFVTGVRGETVGMTAPLSDYYQADEGWWQQGYARGEGAIYIDDRGFDLSVQAVVMGVVAPIYHQQRVVGILKINFKMSHIPAIIANPYPEHDGDRVHVTLMRSRGNAVHDGSEDGHHQHASLREVELMVEERNSGWQIDQHLRSGPDHEVEQSTIDGFARVVPDTPIYSRIVGPEAYRGVAGEGWGKTDWYVFIHRGAEQAFSPLSELLRNSVYIVLGLIAAMVVVLYWMSATISYPLLQLRKAVGEVADGNLESQLKLHQRDEIGELSEDFDRMVKQLKETMVSRDALEQEVAAQTADLIQRNRDLELANKDLEGFSYSVSHDLRAPLRAIDGFVSILEEEYGDCFDDEGKRLLRVVSDNAVKMGLLIDDILMFSRAGRIELDVIRVDMNALVQQVWIELAGERGEDTFLLLCDPLPDAKGDQYILMQIWKHLLSNAIKFSRKCDSPTIHIGAEFQGDRVCYSVEDNGVGFNQKYVDKLFVLFQRLHGMDEYEGTGVGLAIIKRFLQKHGGEVMAEGKLGEGATFRFTLPAAEV